VRALIQRVSTASIRIDREPGGTIGPGLVVFLGVNHSSEQEDTRWLAEKILKLRLFEDGNVSSTGQKSVTDIAGGLLVVSQFTLHASTQKGTKPSYHRAAAPEIAEPLYDHFVQTLRALYQGPIETGRFGAYMQVELNNDGPVTILIDSKNRE